MNSSLKICIHARPGSEYGFLHIAFINGLQTWKPNKLHKFSIESESNSLERSNQDIFYVTIAGSSQ
ncbi:MAG: hypothetical protein OXU24_08810 [Gammaproteobacteria bacterium]|nr:hypothetical protein [Gammaproteobacteria bacterium]